MDWNYFLPPAYLGGRKCPLQPGIARSPDPKGKGKKALFRCFMLIREGGEGESNKIKKKEEESKTKREEEEDCTGKRRRKKKKRRGGGEEKKKGPWPIR